MSGEAISVDGPVFCIVFACAFAVPARRLKFIAASVWLQNKQMGQQKQVHVPFTKDIAALCKEYGLRLTGPRKVIMKVLDESTDHPDAVELHRRVAEIDPGIAIATVYRTLNLLEEKGVLEKHTFADGRARFESACQEHHDHLINVESGDVIEFRSDEIERLQEEIARQHGFEIVSHRLEIYVRPLKRRRKQSGSK